MANEQRPITPEELREALRNRAKAAIRSRAIMQANDIDEAADEIVDAFFVSECLPLVLRLTWPQVEEQDSTIRALQTRLAETRKRAVPEGWRPLRLQTDAELSKDGEPTCLELRGDTGKYRIYRRVGRFGSILLGWSPEWRVAVDAARLVEQENRATESAPEEAAHADAE